MITVYGIPNCDTIKKALTWLRAHDLAFDFHDYKKEGITAAKLYKWCDVLGWETVLNKASTTWKGLDENEKLCVVDQSEAVKIMLANTSLIKRPIIETGRKLLIRFNEEEYKKVLLKK